MSGSKADAEARRLAQREFERPLVLEAGAGTGKTAVLVARIVAWCLGPGWERARQRASAGVAAPDHAALASDTLRRVVAITFTEAAAAENVGVAAFKIAITVGRLPKTRSGKILRGTMRSIADGEAYKTPATIDDPAILDEISDALKEHGVAKA